MSSKSKSSFPSDEQQAVLDSKSRITLVKAAPGSGKTSVFIEFLNRNLNQYPTRRRGIAALSFTNAARDEISKRLNVQIGPQHFIGTLDSFLFKFVVKPFAPSIGLSSDGVELLPSPLDENLNAYQVSYGQNHQEKISALALKFSSGTLDAPIFTARSNFVNIEAIGSYASEILKEKNKIWKGRGLITHSDCHYLAARILCDDKIGTKVRAMIAKRFPLILVDEFQDTGRFLSIALKKIFEDDSIRGLVVGDPDQSIYEFSGAKPELFSEIEQMNGTKVKPITISQRCSPGICEIAKLISDTGTDLKAIEGSPSGKHILFVHKYDKQIRIEEKLLEQLRSLSSGNLAFLCRSNKLVRQISGDHSDIYFQGTSNAGKLFAKAMIKFKQGNARDAYRLISTRIGFLIFGDESLGRKELEAKGVDYRLWKKHCFGLLREIAKDVTGETWNDWLERAKKEAESFAKAFGEKKALSGSFRKDNSKGTAIRELAAPSAPPTDPLVKGAIFKTIHDAKGAEYESVVVFYPKPHAKNAPCLSDVWFRTDGSTEEKRVGYVALTRAKKNLVLCVHQKTFTELQKNRKAFFEKFEVVHA